MTAPSPGSKQYIVDSRGRRVAVVVDIATYEEMVERLEELDDIRSIDEARAEGGTRRPAAEVFETLERERGWRTG